MGAIFFNPSSGGKFSAAAELRSKAEEHRLTFIEVSANVSISQVIRERISRGQTLFIAAGGDGTVNHVAQALIHTEATLGVLPLGTYNHFAKDAGIPLDWEKAWGVAIGGETIPVDVARANDRYFLNNISLGLYPEAVRRREEKGRHYPRWRAIPYAAFMTLRKFHHLSLRVEMPQHSDNVKTLLLMISNNPYDMSQVGLKAPRTSLDGGKLGVYWLPKMARLRFIAVVARYIRGKAGQVEELRAVQTTKVRLHTSHTKIRLGMDGELITMSSPLNVAIAPQSLLLKVPAAPPV